MFRSSLLLSFITAYAASGAVITSSTICDGVASTSGCSNSISQAGVSLSAGLVYTNSVSFNALAFTFGNASASLFFQDSYNLTVNSGAGSGTFVPCLFATADPGSASVSFGSVGASSPARGSSGDCGLAAGPTPVPIPFVDGVPQTVQVTLSVSGNSLANTARDQTSSQSVIQNLQFFDANGNALSNVSFTLVSVEAPESSGGLLVGVSLVILAGFGLSKQRYQITRTGYLAISSSGVKIVQPCSSAWQSSIRSNGSV